MKSKYEGKRVLITGATGFLGKVLLEKLLFSLDCVDRVYVLIRPKAESSLFERFKKEIISSPCFDRLRLKHRGRFDQFIQRKVTLIEGDLLKEGLGFSEKTLTEVVENCHIIINCAASIDFNSPLHEAISINIQGSLRMMELARKVRRLDVFTHISTCYVNCDLRGNIKEEIMSKGDPEQELKMLMAMSKDQLLASAKKIIGSFPNTYTYTKNLCQRMMKARQGDVPLCIVRPAIINASFADPFPAWIDSIAAAAAIFLLVGLGIIKNLKGDPNKIEDIVPVDVVVNTILVASAYNIGNKTLPIYHVGTSHLNPFTWANIRDFGLDLWRQNRPKSQVSQPSIFITKNDFALKIRRIQSKIPLFFYKRLSPLLGKQAQKNVQNLEKAIKLGDQVANTFEFFLMNKWIFECHNVAHLIEFLSVEERKEFLIDITEINILEYVHYCGVGLHKYILKENIDMDKAVNLISLPQKDEYFSELRWALNTDVPSHKKATCQEMKKKLFASRCVIEAIESEKKKRVQAGVADKEAIQATRIEAQRIINQLVGEKQVSAVRTMAWTVHKTFKNLFSKIKVNSEMLEELREIEKDSSIPIVLVPTHRSYLDFLVVAYIFFMYKLRVPNFVADEVLMKANLFPFLLRSAGAFFFQKPLYSKSHLYRTIFDKYLELLLCEGSTLEFCIEGSRSRTGKLQAPTFELMNVVLDTLLSGKVSDVCFVPLTINYEKIVEADNLTGDNLGEEKVAEGLLRMLRSAPFASQNNGRVYVHICKPIMAKQFIENHTKILSLKVTEIELRCELADLLGRQIVQQFTQNTFITSSALVSSVLLMHRKGISEEELVRLVSQLAKYILRKGYLMGGVNQCFSTLTVRNALGLLTGSQKSKSNIIDLPFSNLEGLQKALMLSYYRNSLVHAFLPEAFVGCALASFAEELSSKQGVSLEKLHQQTLCLMRILRNDYALSYSLEEPQKFAHLVRQMTDDLIIKQQQERLAIHPSGQSIIAFYCSLLSANIDCHWASISFVLSIARHHNNRLLITSVSKFYATVLWFMKSMYAEKIIDNYEVCSLDFISGVFESFQKEKFIRIIAGGKKKESAVQVLATLEQLEDIENRIKFFRKRISSSIFSPLQGTKFSLQNGSKL